MKKTGILRNALYQLVGENSSMVKKIKEVNAGYPHIMEICISDDKTSSAWHDSNKIILGIKMLPQLYAICEEITNSFNISSCMNVESKYSSYGEGNIRGILSVSSNDVSCTPPSCIIEKIDFLTENSDSKIKKKYFSAIDTMTLFALGYSICHEVGHLLYDDDIKDSIVKEINADKFAFQVIKDVYDNEINDNNALAHSREIGTFLGVASVLFFRKPECENNDTDHPHTIERMYSMLNYWQIDDSSLLWEIGCHLIEKWINDNAMELPWHKDGTLSYKNKFMCAYGKINEKHQYQFYATPTI